MKNQIDPMLTRRFRSENSDVWCGEILIARCPSICSAIELQAALNFLDENITRAKPFGETWLKQISGDK